MMRLFFRSFCVAGMVILLGIAVFFQFWVATLGTPCVYTVLMLDGVIFDFSNGRWEAKYGHLRTWSVDRVLIPPYLIKQNGAWNLFLPWWLLLAVWGLVTAVVWWATRRRKRVGRAFPVELAAK